jgi:hypothetical protein
MMHSSSGSSSVNTTLSRPVLEVAWHALLCAICLKAVLAEATKLRGYAPQSFHTFYIKCKDWLILQQVPSGITCDE